MQVTVVHYVMFAVMLLNGDARAQSNTAARCTPIDSVGFLITEPGNYCVTKDLNTRLDFADHRAEVAVIEIRTGSVTVDLQGHRIGRAFVVAQHGGYGILISTKEFDGQREAAPRIRNVTIRNGVLSDFHVGVQYEATAYQAPTLIRQVRQTGDHSFIYAEANIVLDNLRFNRCTDDMNIQDWVTR